MSTDIKLKVTEIQRFCMHDGPGVRTTVFLKGCPLRCAWCHNPETQKGTSELLFYPDKCIRCHACVSVCPQKAHTIEKVHRIDRTKCVLCRACAKVCPTKAIEICGTEMSMETILAVVEKDRAFYGELGGVTLSGGEPFAQNERTVALLKACKERGISTAVETCGYANSDILRAAVPFVDLFLFDVKDTDCLRHKQYTGVSNESILNNLTLINSMKARIRFRCILVKGINTKDTHYANVAKLAKSMQNFDGVEWIPYHAYGGKKATFLGGEDNGKKEWIPTPEEIERAKLVLKNYGVRSF